MPRPVSPVGLSPAIFERFNLSDDGCSKIASTLGLPWLPPSIVQTLEVRIGLYKMQSDLPFVTVGENIAAIDGALIVLDKAQKALRHFTDVNRSGVGSKTVHALNPSACEVLASFGNFRAEAQARKKELEEIKRFGVEHGPLGTLCAWVRVIFETVQEAKKARAKKTQLRTFARAVLHAAGIPCDTYCEKPRRMDRLFTPIVPDTVQTQQYITRLRQEIQELLRAVDARFEELCRQEIEKKHR
jgi:hypothetical protein